MRLALLPFAPLAFVAAAFAGDRQPVAYVVVDARAIPEPLAGPGDAVRGRAVATDPTRGACFACHAAPGAGTPGVVGAAPLAEAAAGLDAGALRLAVVHLPIRDPAVEGHAFYDVSDVGEVADERVGETRLTAQEVEDLVAWLANGAP